MNDIQLTAILNEIKSEGVEKIVVGAFIVIQDKFLLIRRIQDDFMGGIVEFPSGGIEEGEDIKNALFREVREETNLEIDKIIDYIGRFTYLSQSGKHSCQINFLVYIEKLQTIILNPQEHDVYFLFPLNINNDLHGINISLETENIIKKGLQIWKELE